MAQQNLGLQLLVGLDETENTEWIQTMTNYHDEMVMNSLLSYPMIPLVRGKRIRPEVHLYEGTITLIFETQKWEVNSIKLTVDQFEMFNVHKPMILDFIQAVQNNTPVSFDTPISKEDGGWQSKLIRLDGNINIKLRWNEAKRYSLVGLIDDHRQFTMCAGAYIRFSDFVCTKVTNAVRMWQDVLTTTDTMRAALLSNFKPECYVLKPQHKPSDPIELEEFYKEFFGQ